MERSIWIREIPEVSASYVKRADALTQAKAELRTKLEEVKRAEAALWAEIVRTEQWSRQETSAALLKMDADVTPYLPNTI